MDISLFARLDKTSWRTAAILVLVAAVPLVADRRADAQIVPGDLPQIEAPPPPPSIYDALIVPDRSPRGTPRNSIQQSERLYELWQRFSDGKDAPKDNVEATYWLKVAILSKLGAQEQRTLGTLAVGNYEKRDYAAARLLWELAAVLGNGNAMYNLGYLFEAGEGVARGVDRARIWYEKAKVAGYDKAQAALDRLKK
jgi:hypothetical protein